MNLRVHAGDKSQVAVFPFSTLHVRVLPPVYPVWHVSVHVPWNGVVIPLQLKMLPVVGVGAGHDNAETNKIKQ